MARDLAKMAEYSRQFETSPIYRKKNTSTIAANAYFQYDWEVSEPTTAKKYLPFNLLIITNNDASNPLELYINGDISPIKYIPASSILTLDEDSVPAFSSVVLKNIGTTTISANTVEVVAQRTGIKQEKIVQNIHQDIYSKKG